MTLGGRIRTVRKSMVPNLSQEQFAISIGKTRPAVAAYELDKVIPDEAVIKLICQTYNVSYAWLKLGEDVPMLNLPDTDDERVDAIMASENDFAKEVMRAFARLGDDEWELLRKIVDQIKNADR